MGLTVLSDKKSASDKRQKIIQAAILVFSKQGFYNSTVADVAREANVADGTIYLYFKNKDDLLISIFEHSIDIFIQAARDEVGAEPNPVEKLKKFVSLHLKLVQKNQEVAQVIQVELRQSSKFMKEYANEKFFDYLNIVQSIVEEGQAQNIFRSSANPMILKRVIFGAVDEIALEWILMKKKRYSMDEAAEQIFNMFIDGLMA